MGSPPEQLVCFHCTTTKLPAEDSETEEEAIAGLSWILVDVKTNQLGSVQRCVVKSGLSGANEALKPTNLALFTEAEQLGDALLKFDQYIEEKVMSSGERWCLITDGQLPLRHFLHLEASRKKVKPSQHFYSFYDLRKEVRRAVRNDMDFKNLEEIASYCKIDVNNNNNNNNSPAGLEHCRLMGGVVQHLIKEGHKFKPLFARWALSCQSSPL